MKILGIETSTQRGSIALMDGATLVRELPLSAALNKHAERLLPQIDTLLKETGTPPSDLAAIAISIGPGSFTGLRVGLATAKGLAYACGLPLLPVPTLEAMAMPFRDAKTAIAPMIVSRKDEVYWALFQPQEGGLLLRLHPDALASREEASRQIRQMMQDEQEVSFIDNSATAYAVAECGRLQMMKGEQKFPEEVLPFYLADFVPRKPSPQSASERRSGSVACTEGGP
jgi:tRNA threonylcarbamoyl adenosine modification protein YeaZ